MKFNVYSYRDRLVGFGQPLIEINDAVAIRGFVHAIRSNGVMRDKPSDFELVKIGEFDSDIGVIIGTEAPVVIYSAKESDISA